MGSKQDREGFSGKCKYILRYSYIHLTILVLLQLGDDCLAGDAQGLGGMTLVVTMLLQGL